MDNAADEDWRILRSLFPQGWGEQARTAGAIERGRGITAPDILLRVFLLHVGKGDSLQRIPAAPHELLLADAGYCKAPGIRSVVAQGADVLVRLHPQALPLLNKNGSSLDLLTTLKTLKTAGQIGEWKVTPVGTEVSGRICAVRKSDESIRLAHRRIQRRASKKQTS